MKPMTVLSLFDGISAGAVALERANIPVAKFYASEIDKYAIKVTMKNYPNTIQLGDVTKWREWNIEWDKIDLLLAGFPCQPWSLAGKQQGDNDKRGMLLWVMLDILHHIQSINPKLIYLFENVKMKKEFADYVNKAIGVEPILINSALVSAQTRKRAYWANIPNIKQPEDKHIYLKDIIEYGVVDRDKSFCIDASYFKGGNLVQYFEKHRRQLVFDKPCQVAHIGKNQQGTRVYGTNGKNVTLKALGGGWGAKTGLILDETKNINIQNPITPHFEEMNRNQILAYVLEHEKRPQPIVIKEQLKSKTVRVGGRGSPIGDDHNWDTIACVSERGRRLTPDGEKRDDKNGEIVRGYEVVSKEKTNCLTTVSKDNYIAENLVIRKLTPVECCRLQTFPDDYFKKDGYDVISRSQQYKCLGNSWTCDVITHILNHIPKE